MSRKPLPFPRPGDSLPRLLEREKGDYRHPWPRFAGAFVALGMWLTRRRRIPLVATSWSLAGIALGAGLLVVAIVLGLLGLALTVPWEHPAIRFHTRFHTVWGTDGWLRWVLGPRTIYYRAGGSTSGATYLHEGIHAWVDHELGGLEHAWMYLFGFRRWELEAQCYAAEVLAGYRTARDAAESLADRMYATRLSGKVEAAQLVIEQFVFQWARHGWTREMLRALGETARG